MHEYTPEERIEAEARHTRAVEILKECQFGLAAQITKEQVAEGIFADKIVCFLRDTKYEQKDGDPNSIVEAEVVSVEAQTVNPVNPQPEA